MYSCILQLARHGFAGFSSAILVAVVLAGAIPLAAGDARPMVGPGATRDEVITAYGWPSGQTKAGGKEILTYPQGRVMLEDGRVERVDFSMTMPWPAPRPRPGSPTASTAKKVETPVDFWLTDFEEAAKQAAGRRARILVLFTGSDWSPASKHFHDEVEFHPEFINAFTGDFVFVRLDFPARTPIAAGLREQNARLRAKYGVTVYPTLLMVSPAGTAVGHVDLTRVPVGETYRARVIAAIGEIRDLLIAQPPPPEAEPTPAPVPLEDVKPEPVSSLEITPPPPAVVASLKSARWLIVLGLGAGAFIAAASLWLVWRAASSVARAPAEPMTTRISDAASGLPTQSQMAAWPREKVRAIIAALAELEGYWVDAPPSSNDTDLVLKRRGEATARVLVSCAAGPVPVTAKRVREMLGTVAAEGVAVGWFVAPAGFAPDARTFAEQNGLVLIDSEPLLAQLRSLPPLLLPKVLARTA